MEMLDNSESETKISKDQNLQSADIRMLQVMLLNSFGRSKIASAQTEETLAPHMHKVFTGLIDQMPILISFYKVFWQHGMTDDLAQQLGRWRGAPLETKLKTPPMIAQWLGDHLVSQAWLQPGNKDSATPCREEPAHRHVRLLLLAMVIKLLLQTSPEKAWLRRQVSGLSRMIAANADVLGADMIAVQQQEITRLYLAAQEAENIIDQLLEKG